MDLTNLDLAGLGLVSQATATKEERPKARFWLNVGFAGRNQDGSDFVITLPYGIALDTMERKGASRNSLALLDKLIAVGENIPAGETKVISNQNGLVMSITHVGEPKGADAAFVAQLNSIQF